MTGQYFVADSSMQRADLGHVDAALDDVDEVDAVEDLRVLVALRRA